MRLSAVSGKWLAVASCLCLLSACAELGFPTETESASSKHPRRHSSVRAQPAPKPEVSSPASHRTCIDTFKLEVGTPRYDKCIASLSELEAKP